MAGIYCAERYCDECTEHLRKLLKAADKVPEHPEDSRTYDSNEYPKDADDDETGDTPDHCTMGVGCLDPLIYEGENYGHFFGNALTEAGVKYVADYVRDDVAAGRSDSIACKVWLPHYISDYPELKGLLLDE